MLIDAPNLRLFFPVYGAASAGQCTLTLLIVQRAPEHPTHDHVVHRGRDTADDKRRTGAHADVAVVAANASEANVVPHADVHGELPV